MTNLEDLNPAVDWFKERQKRANKHPIRNWVIIGLLLILLFGVATFKFQCLKNNSNDYNLDNVFFIDYFKPVCLSVSDYDHQYMGGKLKECLDNNPPQEDIFNCKNEKINY